MKRILVSLLLIHCLSNDFGYNPAFNTWRIVKRLEPIWQKGFSRCFRFKNVVWGSLLQKLLQLFVECLRLVIFPVQPKAKCSVQSGTNFAAIIGGRIEGILEIHYMLFVKFHEGQIVTINAGENAA